LREYLIAVEDGYAKVDVQVLDETIVAIAPRLDVVGTLINGDNKLVTFPQSAGRVFSFLGKPIPLF